MKITFEISLTGSYPISPNTLHLQFKYLGQAPLQFKAGQFISLHIEKDGKVHRRNFSIANAPNGNQDIEFAASIIENGLASTVLHNLEVGQNLTVSGPYGQFTLKDDDNQRYILVATGTGVTPYRSMLPAIASMPEKQFVLLFGVRSREYLLYGEEFRAFANKHSNLQIRICYSREMPPSPSADEFKGYVQDQLEALDIQPDTDIVYLCGNPNMVDAAFLMLQTIQMPRQKVRREKYISSH